MAKSKKGFTIIEVVLVLAIAGLIFLMVFIALPALQRSQRNTQREDDLSRFITAVNDYQSNNGGKTPFQTGLLGSFTKRYIDDNCTASSDGKTVSGKTCGAQFTDPDGEQYVWAKQADATKTTADDKKEASFLGTDAAVDHKLYVVQHSGCGSVERVLKYDSGARNFSLMYKLEGGAVSCNDNH